MGAWVIELALVLVRARDLDGCDLGEHGRYHDIACLVFGHCVFCVFILLPISIASERIDGGQSWTE